MFIPLYVKNGRPLPPLVFFSGHVFVFFWNRKTLCTFYAFIIAVWVLVIYVLLAVAYLVIAVVASGL